MRSLPGRAPRARRRFLRLLDRRDSSPLVGAVAPRALGRAIGQANPLGRASDFNDLPIRARLAHRFPSAQYPENSALEAFGRFGVVL